LLVGNKKAHVINNFIVSKRELTEWFIVISLKLIWLKDHIRSNRIFSVYLNNLIIKNKHIYQSKRVRARLVRRLIWVEELLCSNHNNPIEKLR
jgi:hypothetical protein